MLQVLATNLTEEFAQTVDATTAEAGQRILDLPDLEAWQREALFEPLDRGGWGLWSLHQRRHAARLGGMVAAAASPTELANAAAAEKTARELDAELDRVQHRFGIDGAALLRRSRLELARGGIAGGQASVQSQVTKHTTARFRGTLSPFTASWMDGASSKNADGGGDLAWSVCLGRRTASGAHQHAPRHPFPHRCAAPLLRAPLRPRDVMLMRTFINRRCVWLTLGPAGVARVGV